MPASPKELSSRLSQSARKGLWALALLAFFAADLRGAIAYVSGVSFSKNGLGTNARNVSVAIGDDVLVFIVMENNSAAIAGIWDGGGNSYSQLGSTYTDATNLKRIFVYHAKATASATSVTASMSPGGTGTEAIVTYSGVAAIGVTHVASGTGVTSFNIGLRTQDANNFVVACVSKDSTGAPTITSNSRVTSSNGPGPAGGVGDSSGASPGFVSVSSTGNLVVGDTWGAVAIELRASLPTPTPTFSDSPTSTPSFTETPVDTLTNTPFPTDTNSPTAVSTFSDTPSPSATKTPTPTWSTSRTFTPTRSWTVSGSPTMTFSLSNTFTVTASRTPTPPPTSSFTLTNSCSATPSQSSTETATRSFTSTPSETLSLSETSTLTVTRSSTDTMTTSPTCTQTLTFTESRTPSATRTVSETFTVSPTWSPTVTLVPGEIPGLDHSFLAPAPIFHGQHLRIFTPKAPLTTHVRLYNLMGEKAAELDIDPGGSWAPDRIAAGIYVLVVDVIYRSGETERFTQKMSIFGKP